MYKFLVSSAYFLSCSAYITQVWLLHSGYRLLSIDQIVIIKFFLVLHFCPNHSALAFLSLANGLCDLPFSWHIYDLSTIFMFEVPAWLIIWDWFRSSIIGVSWYCPFDTNHWQWFFIFSCVKFLLLPFCNEWCVESTKHLNIFLLWCVSL